MTPKPIAMRCEEISSILKYCPVTGIFVWIGGGAKNNRIGKIAGRIDRTGYVRIQIHGVDYPAHRLAWFMFYGTEPIGMIDHINGQRADNRICNLRLSNCRANGKNRAEHRDGKLPGTSRERRCISKWRARIKVDGKTRYLGLFDSEQEAHLAYLAVERRIAEGGQ